jgi:hypothetical protein
MTFTYAVTFESLTQPPHTVRGEVSASRTSTGARMAMKDALSQVRRRRWSSVTLVLDRKRTE